MARVPSKPYKEYPLYVRLLWWFQRRKYGVILESTKIWARSPRVFMGLSTLYGALDRKSSPIDPKLRSLITVRVSEINHCPFCIDLNTAIARKRGNTKEKLKELSDFRNSLLYSEMEKDALEYAEAITKNEVSDEIFSALKHHFTDDEIVELTALTAFQNCSTKFNTALGIPAQGILKH